MQILEDKWPEDICMYVCMYVFNTYLVSAPLRGFSGALRAVPSQFRIILISCLCQTDTS